MTINPEKIVLDLCSFPERSTCGKYSEEVLKYLSDSQPNAEIERQIFKTPKNYLIPVSWLIISMIIGLMIAPYYPKIGILITLTSAVSSYLYFNWYSSLITSLPPLNKSVNLIFRKQKNEKSKQKIILMAHWDTAPISLLYKPNMVGNFRTSLNINLSIIGIAALFTIVLAIYQNKLIIYSSYILIGYFIIQLIIANWDFFKYGYSNGASDNATGVAAAITTAQKVWNKNLKDTEVELILTGAEEVGMIGSKAYFNKYKSSFNKNTYLINFDTLGAGELKIITKTGTTGTISYDNPLIETAKKIVSTQPNLKHVENGAWHTAEFDSIWFNRIGIESVTLAALDKEGKMPNIHRETDVMSHVNFKPMHDAVELATAIIIEIDSK